MTRSELKDFMVGILVFRDGGVWWSGRMGNSWETVGMALQLTAQALKARWRCEIPAFDSLPNEALEKIVSHWSRRLARNLTATIDPPAAARPWVLARLIAAVALLSEKSAAGIPFRGLSADELVKLLDDEWRERLRDRWNLMMLEDLDSLEE